MEQTLGQWRQSRKSSIRGSDIKGLMLSPFERSRLPPLRVIFCLSLRVDTFLWTVLSMFGCVSAPRSQSYREVFADI